MNDLVFTDNLSDYKKLVPKEISSHLPIYRDLIYKVAELQKKLDGNLYRVADVEDLERAVANKKITPGRFGLIEEQSGSYKLVRYSDFFQNEFTVIINLLNKIYPDLSSGVYKDYIQSLMTAYSNNNFIDPFKKWVQMGINAYPVDFVLFPDSPERDFRFNTMLSFDASLRVPSKEFLNFKNGDYEQVLIGVVKNLPEFSELHTKAIEDLSRLKIRVDYSIYASGIHAITPYYSQNLPDEQQFADIWGTKVVVYKTHIDRRSTNGLYKFANKYIQDFPMSPQDLSISMTHKFFVHEIVEGLMKPQDDMQRLGAWYSRTREFNSDIFGCNTYVLYLLKNPDIQDYIKYIAYTYVLTAFDYFSRMAKNPEKKSSHYTQYVASINYMQKNGSIRLNEDNKVVVDVKKVLKDFSELSKVSSRLLVSGTQKEAKDFFEQYLDTTFFNKVLNIN